MRLSTDLLPPVPAVTATYIFKNSYLRFNCNLAVSRNKTLCNVFFTNDAHHIDFIISFYFILFCFCRLLDVRNLINYYLKEVHRFQIIFKNAPTQIAIGQLFCILLEKYNLKLRSL